MVEFVAALVVGFFSAAFIVGVSCLFAVPMLLLHAWALQTIWGWYAVTQFHSSPLSYSQALAACVVYAALTMKASSGQSKNGDMVRLLTSGILGPVFFVGFAYLIRYFFL